MPHAKRHHCDAEISDHRSMVERRGELYCRNNLRGDGARRRGAARGRPVRALRRTIVDQRTEVFRGVQTFCCFNCAAAMPVEARSYTLPERAGPPRRGGAHGSGLDAAARRMESGPPVGAAFPRRVGLTLAALVALAACAPAATPAPAPGAEIPRGGTLIFAMWQEPTTLAPHYVNQTIAGLVSQVAVEGLARTDNDGNYVPWLAKSVPTPANAGVKLSPDGKKMDVTWELRPGLKWSDGSPVTSADVKFTWEVWMKDPKVVNRAGFQEIESIDTPNETTAIVRYKNVYGAYQINFSAGLLPKHLLEKEADISKSSYNLLPLGTGPFKFTEFRSGDSIVAERNPLFRGAPDKPYLDKIIFKSVPSSEVVIAQLKGGEVHAMWNLLESQTVDLEKDPNVKLVVWPSPSVERIELNTAKNQDMTDPNSVHPVLGELAVRRALLLATPKQQIIDKLLFGKAKVGTSPVSQGWASPKDLKQEGYDPAKANQLLDQAGWTRGADGIRAKSGVRAKLEIMTTTGNKTREQVEQLLVDEYKAIGVELTIRNLPSSVFLSGSWSAGDPRKRGSYDLAMYASSPDIDPSIIVQQRYHSKFIPSKENSGIGQNYTRFKNQEADKAIDEAGSTLDLEKRKVAYARALKLLNDGVTFIWLFERARIDAFRANVGGYKGNVWDTITWNAEEWFIRR